MENWGLLQKSQVDPESIEQAIARLIEAHNADETAHLGVGQSLQSHAASEVIDHLADSIINDKIQNLSVTPDKLNQNIWYFNPSLESIDGFAMASDDPASRAMLNYYGVVSLRPRNVVGAFICMSAEMDPMPCNTEKDPFFQVWVSDNSGGNNDIVAGMLSDDMFAIYNYTFGIEYNRVANKVRGYISRYYSGSQHKITVDLKTGVPAGEIWRAEWDHLNKVIRFYINNVLISTLDISANYLATTDNFHLDIGVKLKASYTYPDTNFANLIWGQNL